jgi:Putative transposase
MTCPRLTPPHLSHSRKIACPESGPTQALRWVNSRVSFKYKDYRVDGHARQKVMRLATDEFIRRFLIHVLPTVFTASAITDCSQAASAPTTSPARASCSPRRSHANRTSAPMTAINPSRASSRIHAHAVAAA